MPLIIPSNYKQKLLPETTEQAIQLLKVCFQEKLSKTLNLRRITAPLFVLSGTGINDDLNGVERAVTFPIKCMGDRKAEVVHSLAKWKRMKLGAYGIPAGYGLYTDMNAIRSDEELEPAFTVCGSMGLGTYHPRRRPQPGLSEEDRSPDLYTIKRN